MFDIQARYPDTLNDEACYVCQDYLVLDGGRKVCSSCGIDQATRPAKKSAAKPAPEPEDEPTLVSPPPRQPAKAKR